MNKMYLSGIVADPPIWYPQGGGPKHVTFPLCVSHKTKQGQVKRELYNIQTWNGVAEWAYANLKQGQRIMLQGYLTQRRITRPDGSVHNEVEITAEEFFATSGSTKAPANRQGERSGENTKQDVAANM